MARFLIESSPSAQAYAAMIKNPQDRAEALRPLFEKMGGKVEAYYLAVGMAKLFTIIELPDPVDPIVLSALHSAVFASGVNSSVNITPLITSTQSVEAMKLAPEMGYRPPSA